MNPDLFNGFLGPHLARYHELKIRLGYTSFDRTELARNLDEFTTYRYLSSLDQLDERFVFDWIHMLSERSAITKNRMLSYARGFFDYLVRQGLIPHNPALRIPRLKMKKPKPYIYSLYEIHQILQEAAL